MEFTFLLTHVKWRRFKDDKHPIYMTNGKLTNPWQIQVKYWQISQSNKKEAIKEGQKRFSFYYLLFLPLLPSRSPSMTFRPCFFTFWKNWNFHKVQICFCQIPSASARNGCQKMAALAEIRNVQVTYEIKRSTGKGFCLHCSLCV